MTLNPVCESVETAQGVPLTVTGVAQVKIMKNADLLQTASEQFLGKKEHEIKSTVLQTLEGHLRAILGKNDLQGSIQTSTFGPPCRPSTVRLF
jgi:flotillin